MGGSSARKKREKKKDFQKPKLKVGKTKPKAANFTDTSFKSRGAACPTRLILLLNLAGIVVKEQSIHATLPSSNAQFAHHLSLLSSRSDAQRRDALGFLYHVLIDHSNASQPPPEPAAALLSKLLPLVLDGSPAVRAQLLRVLATLPATDIEGSAETILPYVRAGMTHLAADIRGSAMDVLGWAIAAAGRELVSCAGGWIKMLKSFMVVLGWEAEPSAKAAAWTTSKASFGKVGSEGKPMVRCLTVLITFLRVGLVEPDETGPSRRLGSTFPLWHLRQHALPKRSNCYGYLNLFGASRDEEIEVYEDVHARQRIFDSKFRRAVENGFEAAKSEGGEVGRAAAVGTKILKQARTQLENTEA